MNDPLRVSYFIVWRMMLVFLAELFSGVYFGKFSVCKLYNRFSSTNLAQRRNYCYLNCLVFLFNYPKVKLMRNIHCHFKLCKQSLTFNLQNRLVKLPEIYKISPINNNITFYSKLPTTKRFVKLHRLSIVCLVSTLSNIKIYSISFIKFFIKLFPTVKKVRI